MDIGSSPRGKFSEKYQAGALSFEFASNGKKFLQIQDILRKIIQNLTKFQNLLQHIMY